MAIQISLPAKYNYLSVDFPTAYWVIENASIGGEDDAFSIHFTFRAYPSRDARKKTEAKEKVTQLPVGGSIHYAYSAALYEWDAYVKYHEVVPEGTTLSSSDDLKKILYGYVKKRLSLTAENSMDILED